MKLLIIFVAAAMIVLDNAEDGTPRMPGRPGMKAADKAIFPERIRDEVPRFMDRREPIHKIVPLVDEDQSLMDQDLGKGMLCIPYTVTVMTHVHSTNMLLIRFISSRDSYIGTHFGTHS